MSSTFSPVNFAVCVGKCEAKTLWEMYLTRKWKEIIPHVKKEKKGKKPAFVFGSKAKKFKK